jgi:hypothetical protein
LEFYPFNHTPCEDLNTSGDKCLYDWRLNVNFKHCADVLFRIHWVWGMEVERWDSWQVCPLANCMVKYKNRQVLHKLREVRAHQMLRLTSQQKSKKICVNEFVSIQCYHIEEGNQKWIHSIRTFILCSILAANANSPSKTVLLIHWSAFLMPHEVNWHIIVCTFCALVFYVKYDNTACLFAY